MTELEEEIRQIINDITEREYITKLSVRHDDDIWTLYLYLNRELVPMVMSIQGTEDQFKRFVKREMKKRRLHEVKYWKTTREIPVLQCNENGELELGW